MLTVYHHHCLWVCDFWVILCISLLTLVSYVQGRGASHFRLERPLRCEQAREVWGHAHPGKFFKLGTLRSLLRPCLGQNATTITPPVVSVAVEPSCQKYIHARRAHVSPSPICALASRIASKLRSLNSLAATLDAWRLEKVRRRPLTRPKLRQTARRGHSIRFLLGTGWQSQLRHTYIILPSVTSQYQRMSDQA